MNEHNSQKVRHVVSLSGGKDSTALAIYLRDRISNLEYIFCDTGEELPETYEYLERLEAVLGQKIEYLNPRRPFRHYLQLYGGVLPDVRTRWCTRKLKIEPFEKYVGDDLVYSYIGIRADEPHRKGYISTKPNIIPKYPFVEDGITREDVFQILEESGIGLSEYYKWRSHSGCYFCFFQQRIEWLGLLRNHPDLFNKAVEMEKAKKNDVTGERYTWIDGESLEELIKPERIQQIEADFERRKSRTRKPQANLSLTKVFASDIANLEDDESCLICHL